MADVGNPVPPEIVAGAAYDAAPAPTHDALAAGPVDGSPAPAPSAGGPDIADVIDVINALTLVVGDCWLCRRTEALEQCVELN
jgi:hypothetical protein